LGKDALYFSNIRFSLVVFLLLPLFPAFSVDKVIFLLPQRIFVQKAELEKRGGDDNK